MTTPTFRSGATIVEPISAALAGDLDHLLADLPRNRFDVPPTVTALRRDARTAVGSFLGFLVTVATNVDVCVTITQVDHDLEPGEVKSSLRLDLPHQAPDRAPSVVTLFAARVGALVDLAADLAVALHVPYEAVVLDADLPGSTVRAGVTGLREFDVVQQAIGVLVAQGRTVRDARYDLAHRGAPYEAALRVLDDVRG
ncbi:MAG: hypothetical protein ACR2LI_11870 [Propionibacteriaceae bacterium]